MSTESLSQNWLAVPADYHCSLQLQPVLANFVLSAIAADRNLSWTHRSQHHWCAGILLCRNVCFKRLIQPSAWSSKVACCLISMWHRWDEGSFAGQILLCQTLSTNLGAFLLSLQALLPNVAHIPHPISTRARTLNGEVLKVNDHAG